MIVNIIPLAGNGQRFVDGWYTMPKPLIDIRWKYMIDLAFESLPSAEKNIFICKASHIDTYKIDEILQSQIENACIISEKIQKWQASSAYLIKDYISRDDTINIGACDNAMLYDMGKYWNYIHDDNIDLFVWTFKNYHWVTYNPNQYSYCIVDNNENITWVSLKQSISSDPIHDHCLVWAFTFKKAGHFFDAYNTMVENKDVINGEFYIDSVINYCINTWLRAKVFEIDKYIGFWTPNDLKTYLYWAEYFE